MGPVVGSYPKPTGRKSATTGWASCGVVERPDRCCGDDLVQLFREAIIRQPANTSDPDKMTPNLSFNRSYHFVQPQKFRVFN